MKDYKIGDVVKFEKGNNVFVKINNRDINVKVCKTQLYIDPQIIDPINKAISSLSDIRTNFEKIDIKIFTKSDELIEDLLDFEKENKRYIKVSEGLYVITDIQTKECSDGFGGGYVTITTKRLSEDNTLNNKQVVYFQYGSMGNNQYKPEIIHHVNVVTKQFIEGE